MYCAAGYEAPMYRCAPGECDRERERERESKKQRLRIPTFPETQDCKSDLPMRPIAVFGDRES